MQAATTSLATKMLADIDAYAGLGQAGSGAGGAGGAAGAGDVGGVGGAVLAAGANTTREVVARSANLNITVQARAPSQLASEPFAIDRTRVSLPPAVLGKVDGGSAVGLLFFVSRINTHGLGATHGRRRLRSGGIGGGAPTLTVASQLTSFSLRQAPPYISPISRLCLVYVSPVAHFLLRQAAPNPNPSPNHNPSPSPSPNPRQNPTLPLPLGGARAGGERAGGARPPAAASHRAG